MTDRSISDLLCEREHRYLSPFASMTDQSRGRERPTSPCPNRTEYQRDRDRIIHARSFRRLMHKTQVFLFPIDEHYRTRMTHTLEVTQVARVMARALALNEDLTEAIALGHDLGHTPFGHAGEVAMRRCFDPSFSHAEQSLRVVDFIENDGKGLNLTWEVRDGIVNHSGSARAATPEGRLVKFADRIAYINHDIDDACHAGILSVEDIPSQISEVLGSGYSERLDSMISSVIRASKDSPEISMEPEVMEAAESLREFLISRVYRHPMARRGDEKAIGTLCQLFDHFVEHPEEMPAFFYRNCEKDGIRRSVCDYISGMTDRYAINIFEKLFVPDMWSTPAEM